MNSMRATILRRCARAAARLGKPSTPRQLAAMWHNDDPPSERPEDLLARLRAAALRRWPVGYAPLVPRLRRGLPATVQERRARPRRAGDAWRGVLLDLVH